MKKIGLSPEQEIKILRQIIQAISSSLDLEHVLKQTINIVTQVTKGDSCLLYLFNDGKDELILRASKNLHPGILGKIRLKLGEGITGWVAKEREVVAIAKKAGEDPRFKFFRNLPEDKYQAFLSVPIMNRDEITGIINVQHKKEHEHSTNEIALLSAIARQVGNVLVNARIKEEARKRGTQIETLAEISTTIVSNRYLKEILQLIVTMTAEMMNSKICSIMILNEKRKELTIEATQSLSEEYINKPPLKVGESISGKAVKHRKPITVRDVTVEQGYKYPELARKEGICSMLAVPMMIKDRVVGVINSYTDREHSFAKDEIKVLQAIANQAAVAIENTKLMEETIAVKEALKIRKIIERAKGILMKDLGVDEDESYKKIHRKSMDTRRPMKEIAEAIILSSEIRQKT